MTFDDITAPMSASQFIDEYLGQAPLHLPGPAEKFHDIMNWDILNNLLGMASIWSTKSLVLMLDKEPVPFDHYATVEIGRDGGQVLRPDPTKVQGFLAQGATLVANDIDQLSTSMRDFCAAMEQTLGGKVQANLYLSSKRKQGFRVHFDTHDVFAVHVAGEKVWSVFNGRAQDPIAHAVFKELPQAHHEEAKGDLWQDVRLTAGDLLYLPRGQYHYALADDGPCCHIAFGVTYPIGLDVVSSLMGMMVHEPICRANLPKNDDAALKRHLQGIAQAVNKALSDPRTLNDVKAFQAGYSYPRHHYALPSIITDADEKYRVTASQVKLVQQGGRYGLLKIGTNQAVPVPDDVKDLMVWVLDRERFGRAALCDQFKGKSDKVIDKFISDLKGMALVRPDV